MSIQIKGLDQLMQKLGSIEMLQQRLGPPMEESLVLLQKDLAQYPRKSSGAFSRLATERQRRAYWARVRSGMIDHREGIGYVRTGTTGRKWTMEVRRTGNGIIGTIGNNSPGAIWAQSAKHQQPFHEESGWMTDEKAINKNRDEIQDIFRKAIRRELNK